MPRRDGTGPVRKAKMTELELENFLLNNTNLQTKRNGKGYGLGRQFRIGPNGCVRRYKKGNGKGTCCNFN